MGGLIGSQTASARFPVLSSVVICEQRSVDCSSLITAFAFVYVVRVVEVSSLEVVIYFVSCISASATLVMLKLVISVLDFVLVRL